MGVAGDSSNVANTSELGRRVGGVPAGMGGTLVSECDLAWEPCCTFVGVVMGEVVPEALRFFGVGGADA